MALLSTEALHKKLAVVRAVVMDVDGVLTDGRLWLGEDRQWRRFFHIRDGHGVKDIIRAGYKVGWITGSKSIDISARAEKLGIHHLADGQEEKTDALRIFLKEHQLIGDQVLYIGDDTLDLPPMAMCGLKFAVPDAATEVTRQADYITQIPGGEGAVRELCDLLLAFGPHRL